MIVSSQSPFSLADNHYLRDFAFRLRPTYDVPSAFTIRTTLLPAEEARVVVLDWKRLKEQKHATWMVDGWEDGAKRELYGSMAQIRSQRGILLNLEDLTGKRVDGEELFALHKRALDETGLINMNHFSAVVTDDPTLMRKYRRLVGEEWPRLIVSGVFSHTFEVHGKADAEL